VVAADSLDRVWEVIWGDVDGDGDLDMVYSATHTNGGTFLKRNDAGTFAPPQLLGPTGNYLRAADPDNDGDLDFVVSFGGNPYIYLLVNNGDLGFSYVDIGSGSYDDHYFGPAWGDYDNDGDPDLAVTVWDWGTGTEQLEILRNDGNLTFTSIPVPGLDALAIMSWADYDNDGDLDCVASGASSSSPPLSKLFRNDGGTLNVVPSPFVESAGDGFAWADYDNDGDLDLALSGGYEAWGKDLKLYRNDGGAFADVPVSFPGLGETGLAWGDYDNDGKRDLLVSGTTDSEQSVSIILAERDGEFTNVASGLLAEPICFDMDFADWDGDGDLDVSVSATETEFGAGASYLRAFRNDCAPPNTAPTSPAGLTMDYPVGLWTTFRWGPGSDTETPASGLSYNLRIGTTQTGNEILSSMSQWNADPGQMSPRWIGGLGNVQMNRAWRIKLPPVPYITWSVQSIDAGDKASAFASLQQVILGPWINAIADVPNDEGGQVQIRFGASHLDWAGETTYPVVDYKAWKRTGPSAWTLLATIPAAQLPQYTLLAATDGDSSAAGIPWQVYYVSRGDDLQPPGQRVFPGQPGAVCAPGIHRDTVPDGSRPPLVGFPRAGLPDVPGLPRRLHRLRRRKQGGIGAGPGSRDAPHELARHRGNSAPELLRARRRGQLRERERARHRRHPDRRRS